jgi:SAM-dependent methyltransferase
MDFIHDNLNLNGDKRVLEIGCGKGLNLALLSSRGCQLYGIDTNFDYLKQASMIKGNIVLSLMDGERLAFKDAFFDAVILIDVLEHIPDDRQTIKEAHRVLKPGGRLILKVPNKLFLFELHGIRIGRKRLLHTPFSSFIPLLPLLPNTLRKFFATVHVYTLRRLSKMLYDEGFIVLDRIFLMHTLDLFERSRAFSNPVAHAFLLAIIKLIYLLEKTPIIKNSSSFIMVCGEKV